MALEMLALLRVFFTLACADKGLVAEPDRKFSEKP